MKYIYNPVTGQLDDVETPNLGEKYFASAETDKIIKTIDDKFGPGTLFPASDAPTPPKTIERDMFDNAFRDNAANGGTMRQNFSDGSNPIPEKPNFLSLSSFKDKTKTEKIISKYINDLTKYIENKIKVFNKTKILPKEKLEIIPKKLLQEIGLSTNARDYDLIKKAINKVKLPYYIRDSKTGPAKGSDTKGVRDKIDTKILNDFKKNYKTQTITQILERILNKNSRNPEHRTRRNRLMNQIQFLIKQNAIDVKDIRTGKVQPDLKVNVPIEYSSFGQYEVMRENLLENLPDKEKYKTKKGTIKPHVLDQELLKFLNYNTIKGSLSSDFPAKLLPSFEHIEGITPSYIIGDSEGLRKVELNTRKYNWSKTGMSSKSGLFGKVKNYLRTAEAELKLKNNKSAKEALKIVNDIYNKVGSRFKRKRIELPFYKIVDGQIKETNLKGVVKPMTLVKSYFNYFKNVAAGATKNQLERIKKVQPKIFNVLNMLIKGKDSDAKNLIKVRIPEIKGGQLFSTFGGLPIMPTVELSPKITNAFKALKPVARGVGKAAVVVDPIFAALDFSKAIGEGVSGSEATKYTAGKFIEDLANLPRTLEDLAYTATDEGTFKNFGDKKDRFFTYEPRTFAQDYLKRKIEETPEEVLKARQAKIEFDTTIRSNMSMVDDMEIPASKEEIDSAEKEFMDARGVDLSILDNLEEDKDVTFMDIDMDNSVSKSMDQMLADGGRINYEEGSPNPQLEGNDFLNELEFKFNNIDSVTLDDTPITFDDSKSSIRQVADLANPKNYPYYADVAVRAGLRVGEFGARIIPATGNLISDLIQKPLFKIKSSYAREGDNEILDYGETPENNNVKFVGGPIFSNFLNNITPTSTEKLVGLDTIINEEKKKMIARGSSSLPVKVAETAALGAEIVAPIFPGLKLLNSYAKTKKLPVNDDTKQLLEQDIDSVLTASGTDRRQFLQVTGASATVVLAKMLGIGDEVAVATKTAEKATAQVAKGVPPYFFDLVEKIRKLGDDVTPKYSTQERQVVTKYKDFELTEDIATGEITIQRIKIDDANPQYYDETLAEDVYMNYKPGKGQVDETTPNVADEYTEDTSYIRTTGPQKGDILDTVEGVNIEEILKDFQ